MQKIALVHVVYNFTTKLKFGVILLLNPLTMCPDSWICVV